MFLTFFFNLITFKILKDFNIVGDSLKNPIFRGGGRFTKKTIYREELP